MNLWIPWKKCMYYLTVIVVLISHVCGHGRLMEPPGRNAMWRFGFPNPVNYNDNELFCGGYAGRWCY